MVVQINVSAEILLAPPQRVINKIKAKFVYKQDINKISDYVLVGSTSDTCDFITTFSECEVAAQQLGLSDTTATASKDWYGGYDPPYCWIENGWLQFNSEGKNTGACGGGQGQGYDECLCKSPVTTTGEQVNLVRCWHTEVLAMDYLSYNVSSALHSAMCFDIIRYANDASQQCQYNIQICHQFCQRLGSSMDSMKPWVPPIQTGGTELKQLFNRCL